MVILTVLATHTVIGFTLSQRLCVFCIKCESSRCTFFDVLGILFVIVFVYPFPIDSLLLSPTGSLGLGLLVVAQPIFKELNGMSGLKPLLCASWYTSNTFSKPLHKLPLPAANKIIL